MKGVKNVAQTKTQKDINIFVLDKQYKFETLTYNLNETENYFEIYDTRVTKRIAL